MGAGGPGAELARSIAQIKPVLLRSTIRGTAGPQGFSTITETLEVIENDSGP